MRGSLGVALLAGCGFSHGSLPGAGVTTIVDDSAADFAAGTPAGMTIDKLGLLAPDAFSPGGLHARAYAQKDLVTPATSWASLEAALPATSLGEGYGIQLVNWAGDRPYGVGITTGRLDSFTLVVDGEIHLPAGRTMLQLVGDDAAFVEIDVGGAWAGVHARFSDPMPPTLTVDVPAEGWYPIRGAVSESSGEAKMELSIVDGVMKTVVPASDLRARVTDATGVSVIATNDRMFTTPVAGIAVELTLVDRTFNGAPGYDFQNLNGNYMALRYIGQVRIDARGEHTFSLDVGADANDFARLFIDDKAVAGRWPGMPDQPKSDPVELAPGWHDLILDYVQTTGNASIDLTMTTPTTAAAPIASDHLRPVRNGGLLLRTMTAGNVLLLDNATKTIEMPAMTVPAGAVVELVDVVFQLVNQSRTAMTLDVIDGAKMETLTIPEKPPYEGLYDFFPGLSTLAGAPVEATWKLAFTDTDPATTGPYIVNPAIIATYRGGPEMPFATTMTYKSSPHEIAGTVVDARALGTLDGVDVTLEVRTGSAESIASAPWQAPPIESAGLVEYRLAIASDGWHYPTVDRVEIDVQP